MKKKSIKVLTIKALPKTKNMETGVESLERVSFRESKEHFCVYTLKQGEVITKDPATGVITAAGPVKVGDNVIATLDAITLKDGQAGEGWYFLTAQSVDAYVQAEATRDIAALVTLQQQRNQLAITKEFAGVDLTALMAGS